MIRFKKIFGYAVSNVIGMIHVGALPGTPCYEGSIAKLVDSACKEAEIYKECAIDGILLENMHDIPYVQSKDMGPEVTSALTTICTHVRSVLPSTIPCGVQVLAAANREALAVALSAELQFIRAEGFVFSHVADEGWTDACAGTLLRYRRAIGAENVLIFTDIKKKHSAHAVTADVSLQDTVKAAEFFLSDGVIITGTATGEPVDVAELHQAKMCAKGPVIIGSGVTQENLLDYAAANALIVGSHFKKYGNWQNDADTDSIKRFMEKVFALRRKEGTEVH